MPVFEEPTLTRDILSYVAERIDTGASITIQEFEQAFRGTSFADLRYHIGIAMDLELLEVEDCLARQIGTPGTDGYWTNILSINASGHVMRQQEGNIQIAVRILMHGSPAAKRILPSRRRPLPIS